MSRDKEFGEPEGLDGRGKRAYAAIMAHLTKNESDDFKLETGGCRTFYSPEEWMARGEKYGKGAVLIVVYDGGDVRPYFNLDAAYDSHCMVASFMQESGLDIPKSDPYATHTGMSEALKAKGLHAEECTGWYSAIYAS